MSAGTITSCEKTYQVQSAYERSEMAAKAMLELRRIREQEIRELNKPCNEMKQAVVFSYWDRSGYGFISIGDGETISFGKKGFRLATFVNGNIVLGKASTAYLDNNPVVPGEKVRYAISTSKDGEKQFVIWTKQECVDEVTMTAAYRRLFRAIWVSSKEVAEDTLHAFWTGYTVEEYAIALKEFRAANQNLLGIVAVFELDESDGKWIESSVEELATQTITDIP
jgi:hypothetical protein